MPYSTQVATDPTAGLFALLAVVVVVATCLGWLARVVGQPAVIGEMAAGLLMAPALQAVLPTGRVSTSGARSTLETIAQIGLACYAFGIGRELELGGGRLVRRQTRSVAGAALVLPLVGGAVAAWCLGVGRDDTRPHVEALCVGIALAVTAVPVLARLIEDCNMSGTTPGKVALGAAALGDACIWPVLAALVLVTGQHTLSASHLLLLGLLIVMSALARVVLRWAVRASGQPHGMRAAVVLGTVLAYASVTSAAGLHAVLGAMVCGVLCPTPRTDDEAQVLSPVATVGVLLLPAFFVMTGLRLTVSTGGLATVALTTVVLSLVAMSTKALSAGVAARLSGASRADAWQIAVLMNARGVTELVVLGLLRDARLLSGQTYTALVLVTVVTTGLTGWLTARTARAAAVVADRARLQEAQPVKRGSDPDRGTPPPSMTTGRTTHAA